MTCQSRAWAEPGSKEISLFKVLIPIVLLVLLASCGNGNSDAAPNSELAIQTLPGLVTISTAGSRGAVTLNIGEQRRFRINRTVRSTGIPDEVTVVTGDSDFNFSDPDVAVMDINGLLTAQEAGITTLEVVYRDGGINPTDDDKVFLDITVLPN